MSDVLDVTQNTRVLHKFPSIEQFRTVVKQVKDRATFVGLDENGEIIRNLTAKAPIVKFRGSVKLHGSNFSIVLTKDDDYYAQSRERIMSITSDNAGSCSYAMRHRDVFTKLLKPFIKDDIKRVAVYGEWAGQGVQSGVAIANIEKTFFVFALKVIHEDDTTEWLSDISSFCEPEIRLYNIHQFKQYEIDIDFNEPEQSINQMVEWMLEVEAQCPVGKYFGHDGIGEGLVFVGDGYIFKVKGEKHSVSKVKTMIPVDIEKINSINAFVEYAVTEARLEQGVTVLKENGGDPGPKTIGQFLSWVNGDVIKEETDTIVGNEIDVKALSKAMSVKARTWFIEKYF